MRRPYVPDSKGGCVPGSMRGCVPKSMAGCPPCLNVTEDVHCTTSSSLCRNKTAWTSCRLCGTHNTTEILNKNIVQFKANPIQSTKFCSASRSFVVRMHVRTVRSELKIHIPEESMIVTERAPDHNSVLNSDQVPLLTRKQTLRTVNNSVEYKPKRKSRFAIK